MEMDILVILLMAFGLFAILMFILFYIYAKKHYNDKHINDSFELVDDEPKSETLHHNIKQESIIEEIKEKDSKQLSENTLDDETIFVPKKKKDH